MQISKKLLFIQLPNLDNHIGGQYENLRLAATYLQSAMESAGEDKYFTSSICPASADNMDDRHLVKFITENKTPSIIAATLYLWNVERTLHVLRIVKEKLPSVKILVGGPEVSPDHPFLFKSGVPDAVVIGEGEQVFPSILKALRTGITTDLTPIAWRNGGNYVFGKNKVPGRDLATLLPPPAHRFNKPGPNGVAYMETSRGCPLKCAFCCYNQRRRGVSHIRADDVIKRVRILIKRGAKEIRFIDPTFNSNPDFEKILLGLIDINVRHSVSFFAELRAETVTRNQADLLKKANFREIEVGVQSRDKSVLHAIRRPTRIDMLDRGIKYMSRNGIRLTVDIMCGLPFQGLHDVRKSLRWAFRVKNSYVQFLHTYLIPGTELRSRRKQLGLVSQIGPPYRVISTGSMSADDINTAEKMALKHAGRLMDSPASKFTGSSLPDLFDEQVCVDLSKGVPVLIPGKTNRRAIIIAGTNLYSQRDVILGIAKLAIQKEPHILWQFVLSPSNEEPLDLLDIIKDEIDKYPAHLLDNIAVNPDGHRRVARRIFVLLRNDRKYRRSWVNAVEDLLRANFY